MSMNRPRTGSRAGDTRRPSVIGKVNNVDCLDYTRTSKSPPKKGVAVAPSPPPNLAVASTGSRGGASSSSSRQGNPYSSPPRKVSLVVELKEKIVCLEELNKSLTTEMENLQRDKVDLTQRVNQLDVELKGNLRRVELLEEEKKILSSNMVDNRDEMHTREKEISTLTSEKRHLESEKLCLMDQKCELEGQLEEADRKLMDTSKRADEAEAAVTMAMEELDTLSSKIRSPNNSEQAFIAEITKKIEISGLQSCKSVLRKELKRFCNMVLKAKEEVSEAKATIEALKQEQARWKDEKDKLSAAQEDAVEKSGQFENQERILQGKINTLEARVRELEADLKTYKEDKKRILAEADKLQSCSCAPHQRIEVIKANIQMLRDNSRKGMEQVQKQVSDMGSIKTEDKLAVERAKDEMRKKIKILAHESTEAMTKAEEQLVTLRKEVQGLDAAFKVAREATHQSEQNIWEAVGKLGVSNKDKSLLPAIPASATYVLALGLFAYTLYNSSSSSD